jgi:hypothetical protein
MTHADIINMAKARINAAEGSIAKFAAVLLKDPDHALTWGTGVFKDTADLAIWKLVQSMAEGEGECTIDVIVEHVHDHLVGGAVRPSYSTNFAKNHLEQEKTRALGEVYRELSRRQKDAREAAALAAASKAQTV